MARIGPLHLGATRTAALVGGIVSTALTGTLLWRPVANGELPLTAVALGGIVAGYLAARRGGEADGAAAGAGVLGAVPAFGWFLPDFLDAYAALAGPVWLHAVGVGMAAVLGLFVVGVGAVVGLLGGRAGRWLVERTGTRGAAAGP